MALQHRGMKVIDKYESNECDDIKEINIAIFEQEGRKEIFYLMTHSTHFIYGYMSSDMVKDHSDSREETCYCHMGYSF